jgi:ribonuclease HI
MLIHAHTTDHVDLYTDSHVCLKTLTEWYPKRLKQGSEQELKNLDLIVIAYTLLHQYGMHDRVTIHHVKSHQNQPGLICKGNTMADMYATEILRQ